MVEVISEAIRAVEYDEDRLQMKVTFTTGRTYTYYKVPAWHYRALIVAPSIGAYFNENIRDRYQFKRE